MVDNGTVMLIDGHSQIYRAFYGVPMLTNSRQEPINALFAFARFLIWLDNTYPHQFGAVVFDKGPPRQRLALLPEYKAQRPPMPDDLRVQIPAIRQWLQAAGWPLLEEDGREADDLIAAVVKERAGHPVYVVSHDKDIGQLVGEGVVQLVPEKPGVKARLKEVSASVIEGKYGVPPSAIVDWLAMVGDSSDNIPGLPGVGPKTATALLRRFGDLETMIGRSHEIEQPRLRETVENSADLLRKNRRLVQLDHSPPAGWQGLSALRRKQPDWKQLREFAIGNSFKSLLPVIEEGLQASRSPMLL